MNIENLRERVIASIQREGAFDMLAYKPYCWLGRTYSSATPLGCGTACCLAGHIVAEAYGNEVLMNLEYENVPDLAREAWSAAYGKIEGKRLGFDIPSWGEDLDSVTVDEVVAHLNGAAPVRHELDELDE